MIDHNLLHRELVNFAETLTQDFDVSDELHQVSVTAAAALDVDGAGLTVTMPSGDTHYISATDPTTLHVEREQDQLKEGACVDAISTSQVVAADDLTRDERWPRLRPVLLEAGFNAAVGVPIRFRGSNIGALNLYANESRAWTTEEFTAGRLVADLAAGYLINSVLLRTTEVLADQLQQALDSRIVIEQAKGVIAGRHGLTPDAAFELLRTYSRSNRVKLHGVAEAVVQGDVDVLNRAREDHSTRS